MYRNTDSAVQSYNSLLVRSAFGAATNTCHLLPRVIVGTCGFLLFGDMLEMFVLDAFK